MAIVLHKLVYSSRFYLKRASWTCFVLVFYFSGEPASRLGEVPFDVSDGSWNRI